MGSNYIAGTLLDAGADLSEHTALYYATEDGNNDIVTKLLMAGAEQ